MPQSHTADQPSAPRTRATEYKKPHAIKKTIKLKQPALLDAKLDRTLIRQNRTRTKCKTSTDNGSKISNESTIT